MATVLVTGGTGTLGAVLVPSLLRRGHEVRVVSRGGGEIAGAEVVRGDVCRKEDVETAMEGVEVVVHAATSPSRRARRTEIEGTQNVVDQCARTGAHVVYVSIVGVDRHRFPYYQAKWAAEQLVEASGAGWTIQRATQFHSLLDRMLDGPAFFSTPNLAFQPIAPDDLAQRLVELVAAGPSGRTPDYGGPEVLPIGELVAIRRRVTGKKTTLLRMPRVWAFRDFDAGIQVCPSNASGTVGWEQWLSSRYASATAS